MSNRRPSIAAHHAEWLSLLDVSGPFLSVPVLKDALPNGLDAHDSHVAAEVRAALEQWTDPELIDGGSLDSVAIHMAFARFVLHDVLGFDDDVLRWDDETTSKFTVDTARHGRLAPTAVVLDGGRPLMLVSVYGPGLSVDELMPESGTATPQQLMVEHLKAAGLRVGLVTDGERWTLVSHKEGENPGFATWWSSLWSEEKITLQAFRTLLHQDRFLTLGEEETIGGLLDRSAQDQSEVTTKLGKQTLEAVEILIRSIDRIDQESGGDLLREVEQEKGIAELYDAAVTVMMRLIFLFYAEENDLLPMSEPLYIERYAMSSLRERLQAAADEYGEEVLETTHDGWPRLLSTWRGVYGGVEHGDMVLAPYGGSLFDPDRYPFLEGRQPGSSWLTDEADPLPIDNRTVLHLLSALQTLDEGGHRRKLSFRALDVEQIGHVYEGMLDHTAARAKGWVLGLSGTGGREPEIELDELESFDDERALLSFLKDKTGRGTATIKKWMVGNEADNAVDNFGPTWSGTFGHDLIERRVRPFAKLVRPDSTNTPTAFRPGRVFVADSSHRGATGAHYTPRSLTEEIVRHTLDPLVYVEPPEGAVGDVRGLRTPEEILGLKVCDPACGSGAFLVQACRYLADVIVEAERTHGRRSDPITEREVIEARRQVAERCLHGVDLNPMACEMAKLSLWLVTLAKDSPFSFLDHAIRNGDSLVGIDDLDQLVHFHLDPDRGRTLHAGTLFNVEEVVHSQAESAARALAQISAIPSRDLNDVALKLQLNSQARIALRALSEAADEVVLAHFESTDLRHYEARMLDNAARAAQTIRSDVALREGVGKSANQRPFHWPLEFPAVFISKSVPGFDAVVMNPPFLGGKKISGAFGAAYRRYLTAVVARTDMGTADLCVAFLLRGASLVHPAGRLGLVATSSIGEGDSQQVGLEQLLEKDWRIARAVRQAEWPGVASLTISKIWLSPKRESSSPVLDGLTTTAISSALVERGRVVGLPRPLAQNANRSFIGSFVNGKGFVLTQDEAESMIERDERNKDVLFPYLGGDDCNSSPTHSASRWVINFFDWTEERSSTYSEPFGRVERLVKPVRANVKRKAHRERWWQYGDKRPALYARLASTEFAAATVRHSHLMRPAIISNDIVFSDALAVFPIDDWTLGGWLLSEPHRVWAISNGSTLGHAPRYTPSDCFDTFPFLSSGEVAILGEKVFKNRRRVMEDRSIGLLDLYRELANGGDDELKSLQDDHLALDGAALSALGLDRSLAEPLRSGLEVRTVVDAIKEVNFYSFAEEVEQRLHPGVDKTQIITADDGTIRLEVG